MRLDTPITFKDRVLHLKSSTAATLKATEAQIPAENGGLVYQLAVRHHTNTSLTQLAKDLSVNRKTISALFDFFGIPKLSGREALTRKWEQDPTFRSWHENHAANVLNDPNSKDDKHDTRKAHLEKQMQDPEFEKARLDGLREKSKDPAYLAKRGRAIAANWEDQKFRDAHEETERIKLASLKQDPGFRLSQAHGIRNSNRIPKCSIQGERIDIGFAQSTYEANIARILTLVGADFQRGLAFALQPEEKSEKLTALTLDFVVNIKGRQKIYEIVTGRNIRRLQLLEMLATQNPKLRINIITERRYRRLRGMFQDRINNDPRFAGWETPKDNLRTNPTRYAA